MEQSACEIRRHMQRTSRRLRASVAQSTITGKTFQQGVRYLALVGRDLFDAELREFVREASGF